VGDGMLRESKGKQHEIYGYIVNVIGVAQNVNRSRPLVINYSLLISGQFFKRKPFGHPVE